MLAAASAGSIPRDMDSDRKAIRGRFALALERGVPRTEGGRKAVAMKVRTSFGPPPAGRGLTDPRSTGGPSPQARKTQLNDRRSTR